MSYNTANTVNDVWCWADHESPLSEPVSPKKEELHNMMLLTDGSQTIGVFKTTNGEHTSYDVTIKSEDHQQQQQQYNESYPSYSPYISSSESFSFSPFLTGSPIPSPTFSSTSHPSTMTTSFSFLPRTIGQTFSPASSPPLLPLSDDISVQLEDSPSIAPLSSPTFAKPSPALAPRFTPTLTSTPSSNSHHLQQPSHVSIAFSPHQLTRLSNPSLSLETFSLPPPSPTASLRHASQPFRVKQQQQQNNQQQHQNNQQQQLINQNNQNQQQNNNNNIININNISPPNSPKSFLNSNQQHAPTIRSALEVIALCHNVTPVFSKETNEISFQAASPDEIALTEFAMSVGLKLNKRDAHCIELINPFGKTETYEILNDFPFTSQRKRMGIILRCNKTNEITFFCKGADIVMNQIVQPNDWMSEECENLAREGLRTLVLARKSLTNEEYEIFLSKYIQAKSSLNDRSIKVEEVVGMLEIDMELIAVTGVEDKLQNDVRTTLETLKNACIRVWMLTGDKIETAKCVALSSGLVMKMQDILTLTIDSPNEVSKLINKLRFRSDCALVIDGDSLKWCLNSSRRQEFLELSTQCPSVIVCRCSPTQKAEIVISVREFTKNRVCSIGDGGNDVSMIQVADVGIGVVGKEGKQASLAADFSINEFSHLKRLMLWHGRNSYKSTARLSQFVIHRGLTISVMQAVFSAIFYYAPIPLFTGWLMVGYATVYTMLPVFSLVLDKDVTDEAVFIYPELYHDIQKGKSLSLLTFTLWQMRSVYQGGIIIILTIYLFERQFAHIVTIAFTSLIMIELLNVAVEIRKWHPFHVWSLLVTVIIYVSSLFFLGGYFNTQILLSSLSSLLLIVFFTMGPIILIKFVRFRLFPPSSSKLS
eukprot:c19046_g1_i1.p1 GENE.c19046_g1_i1~~c19046_g1_i1.p1  ORF type:complete len:877 (+),score=420.26 c19046_g1_i1:85-2715(+)